MARKKKRRSLRAGVLDSILCAVDWLCESMAAAIVSLLGALVKGAWALVSGAVRLLFRLCGWVLSVPVWAIRLKLEKAEFEEFLEKRKR